MCFWKTLLMKIACNETVQFQWTYTIKSTSDPAVQSIQEFWGTFRIRILQVFDCIMCFNETDITSGDALVSMAYILACITENKTLSFLQPRLHFLFPPLALPNFTAQESTIMKNYFLLPSFRPYPTFHLQSPCKRSSTFPFMCMLKVREPTSTNLSYCSLLSDRILTTDCVTAKLIDHNSNTLVCHFFGKYCSYGPTA